MKKALLFALALIAVGCGEPAGPPMDVTITATTTQSIAYNDDTQRWECHSNLTATATGGRDGESAMWDLSEVQHRYVDGSTDIWSMSLTQIQDFWGSDRIQTGDVLTASRINWGNQSFNIMYSFRLEMPDLSLKSIAVFVAC